MKINLLLVALYLIHSTKTMHHTVTVVHNNKKHNNKKQGLPTYPTFLDRVGKGQTEVISIVAFFFFFFGFSFTSLSSFFTHIETNQSVGGAKTGVPREKPPDTPASRTWLVSHMNSCPVRGANPHR